MKKSLLAAVISISMMWLSLPLVTLGAGFNNLNVTGNINLVPSTATDGNILKNLSPFIHNFGSENTFIGEIAGNFTMTGSNNAAIGYSSLGKNTTGSYNTAGGANVLSDNTTGNENTANGAYALFQNTTGSNNTGSGFHALFFNTAGWDNTAYGHSALQGNTAGSSNVAVGSGSLIANTTGFSNTAIGTYTLPSNTTGVSNIAIGASAGINLTTGSDNIVIGNAGVAGESSTIRVGNVQSRSFIAGIRGITTGNFNAVPVVIDSAGQLGTISSSRRFKDDIADMGGASEVLMKLRPVTFHYKSDRTDRDPQHRTLQYGLIAEEVNAVAPNLVARSAEGAIESVYYQHLTPMLLNEFQKQQRTIEAQAAALAKQTERLAALEKQSQEIAALKEQLAQMTAALSRLQGPERVAAMQGSE